MTEKKNSGSFDRKSLQRPAGSEPRSASAEKVELSPIALRVASQYRNESISPALFTGLMRVWEFFLVALCGTVIYLGYVGVQNAHLIEYLVANILAAALYVVFAQ